MITYKTKVKRINIKIINYLIRRKKRKKAERKKDEEESECQWKSDAS